MPRALAQLTSHPTSAGPPSPGWLVRWQGIAPEPWEPIGRGGAAWKERAQSYEEGGLGLEDAAASRLSRRKETNPYRMVSQRVMPR